MTIDYQALRDAAVAVETEPMHQNFVAFRMAFTPSVALALLDEIKRLEDTNIDAMCRIAELETNLAALAAENAGLKSDAPLGAIENGRAFADRLENYQFECEGGNLNMCSDWQEFRCCFEYLSEWAMHSKTEHPATDAFLAEVRAEARNEGINYTASRLAAAFNHGFINKSLREVFDVTRMILSAKEELANEPHPIDGLSGEYAEKSLEEWAEQIRKGGNQ